MKINNNAAPLKKQPSFGNAALGKKMFSSNTFNKIAKNLEYDNFTMSFPVTLGLLYGATVLPRYIQAYDKHDRREILTRDLTSITAILFFAASLRKGFSKLSSKATGFALNLKPKNHKGIKKYVDYINPRGGVQVMNKEQIIAKYSDLEANKNGFVDFAEFIRSQGGKLNKVLASNQNTKAEFEKMLGKDLKSSTHQEILDAWKNASKESKDKVYAEFKNPDNSFTKKARVHNNVFNAVSTFLMVPAFMIWLEIFNEKTTKRLKAKENEELANTMKAKEAQKAKSGFDTMKVSSYHSTDARQSFKNFFKMVNNKGEV